MQFNQTFYHYQKQILQTFQKDLERGDNKIHIVAPPGSWKTIFGIEMMNELFSKKKWISLILVPNTVLQVQWRDKIQNFFLESGEDIDELVSFDLEKIKKVNILTYQAITQSKKDKDFIEREVLQLWKEKEWYILEDFEKYIEELRFEKPEYYADKFKSYKKKIKNSDNVFPILSPKVQKYFYEIQKNWVSSMILDEAHHLTSWWSKVLYNLYTFLPSCYVVWLTATPPFDDVDYFTLDENYISLLGEVDYYIPTPAIIKSGKLAPYNDLVQFVELPKNYMDMLEEKNDKLKKLIEKNKNSMKKFFVKYLDNYDDKIKEDKYIYWVLSFCNIFLGLEVNKFNTKNFTNLKFEDIVYSLSLWLREEKKSNSLSTEGFSPLKKYRKLKHSVENEVDIFQEFKNILYEIWYVWKKSKFVKFFSYIDKLEIYNPEKIKAVKNILDKEKSNLWDNLRCVIITDFFEDVDWLLDCKNILQNLVEFEDLNPTLVSGQWILDLNWEIQNKNILQITEDFNKWKIKLLIGTRWILWEWWDSPKVNTLIDLTWVSSFMTTNQVRWRAIRLDKSSIYKTSNIYDIVTIDKNQILHKDLKRLEKKHNQVYWVDDSWLVIKWINHIYQNINNRLLTEEFNPLNKLMLQRSEKRSYFYKLWQIWDKFENKEQFILQLNINPLFKYFSSKLWFFWRIYLFYSKFKKINLNSIWEKTYYDNLIRNYIEIFLYASKKILIETEVLSEDFDYKLILEWAWKYKIIWEKNTDDFEIKKFIEVVSQIFSPVLDQKYLFTDNIYFLDNWKVKNINYNFPLPSQLSNNKNIRKKWFYYFYWYSKIRQNIKFIWDFDYKILKRFKYLSSDRKKHLWYQSFINCNVEKIWM